MTLNQILFVVRHLTVKLLLHLTTWALAIGVRSCDQCMVFGSLNGLAISAWSWSCDQCIVLRSVHGLGLVISV